jgi:hypothetical protein
MEALTYGHERQETEHRIRTKLRQAELESQRPLSEVLAPCKVKDLQ